MRVILIVKQKHSARVGAQGRNCLTSLKNLGKIGNFRAATRNYLGKSEFFGQRQRIIWEKQIFLCTENKLLLEDKVSKFRKKIKIRSKELFLDSTIIFGQSV